MLGDANRRIIGRFPDQETMPELVDFVADTHVHLYEGYDLPVLLSSARSNLVRVAPRLQKPRKLLCLTERLGCDLFGALASGSSSAFDSVTRAGIKLLPTAESCSLRILFPDGDDLYLIAGRQLATAERLELLALATREQLPDRLTLSESITAAQRSGAAVVLNWSPGKWMFAKYPIVHAALEQLRPGIDFLGDVAMRPYGWGEPDLIRRGRERGLRVLAGSDPLPLPGEERLVGSYGIAGRMIEDDTPARTMLAALQSDGSRVAGSPVTGSPAEVTGPASGFEIVGCRSSVVSTIRRFVQNRGQTMYRPPSVTGTGGNASRL